MATPTPPPSPPAGLTLPSTLSSPASTSTLFDSPSSTISLHFPPRLLTLPPAAFAIGALLGMSRGGSKARLRFLAENAHRQPTTVQGWYFYTKTRNYRILFSALRQGSKTGALLGASTALYVLSEEGIRSIRGQLRNFNTAVQAVNQKGKGREVDAGGLKDVVPVEEGRLRLSGGKEREGVDELVWIDGGAAGGLLGIVIGIFNKFPRPLLLRTTLFGIILGTAEGGLRIAQDKIARLKEAEDVRARLEGEQEDGVREVVNGERRVV